MNGWTYLRSRLYVLAAAAALCALAWVVLAVSGVGADTRAVVCGLIVAACALVLAAGWLRVRRFYRELEHLTAELDEARLMPALLDEPSFPEGRAAYEALRLVAHDASDEVAAARRQVEEYRTYVEAWVHEAKSPLAAANLALDNLSAAARAGEAPTARQLSALRDELARVDGFIEQALFYARSESLERDYVVRSHRLDEMVSAALKRDAGELIDAGVAPKLGNGLELKVHCDDKWLLFILGQLIQNSVRYARPVAPDGPQLRFSAQLLDKGAASERVELTVADNGIGCPAADLPRVTERGFTGENGRARDHATGLGLWLAARLCAKMGLSMDVASREGEGFSVTIGFPTNKMHYFD